MADKTLLELARKNLHETRCLIEEYIQFIKETDNEKDRDLAITALGYDPRKHQ